MKWKQLEEDVTIDAQIQFIGVFLGQDLIGISGILKLQLEDNVCHIELFSFTDDLDFHMSVVETTTDLEESIRHCFSARLELSEPR